MSMNDVIGELITRWEVAVFKKKKVNDLRADSTLSQIQWQNMERGIAGIVFYGDLNQIIDKLHRGSLLDWSPFPSPSNFPHQQHKA